MKLREIIVLLLVSLLFIVTLSFLISEPKGPAYSFNVDCDWEKIKPALKNALPEKYGLYNKSTPPEYDSEWDRIEFTNYKTIEEERNTKNKTMVNVSYGAIFSHKLRAQKQPPENAVDIYFGCYSRPMIKLIISRSTDDDHNYYEVIYNLKGKLVEESGSWFLEEDKDEYCRYYFDAMLEMIGKK